MTQPAVTALHDLHVRLGARMADFAGWDLPIQYPAGIVAEHLHTRAAASLFDVSHMGQVLVRPSDGDVAAAAAALESVTPANIVGLAPWRQRYALFTTADGGVADDLMVTNHGTHLFLVVNASRTDEDLAILRTVAGVEVEHVTDRGLLALQGPLAGAALARLVPQVFDLVFMDSVKLAWDDVELWVSRSGYTGEDGFEISVPAGRVVQLAEALLAMAEVQPAGLGARDSLRLEAGMPLHGHELTPDISPAQADLGFAVPKIRRPGGSREGGYPGADVIGAELVNGPDVIRVGLRPEGRAPVRDGVALFADEDATDPIGTVTSGGFGPTVAGPIAMGMVPSQVQPGATVLAEVRGRRLPVTVCSLPFVPHHYKR